MKAKMFAQRSRVGQWVTEVVNMGDPKRELGRHE